MFSQEVGKGKHDNHLGYWGLIDHTMADKKRRGKMKVHILLPLFFYILVKDII